MSTAESLSSATKLARIFGIDIRVHVSVLIIFALVVSSLAGNLFPQWHPQWSTALNWIAAIVAGLLFFASLLIHELSHSLVAQRCGIEISAITLFLFGGVAELKGEPQTPKDEFLIAGAGPLASFVLAVLFALLASVAVTDAELLRRASDLNMAELNVTTTVCLWLSTINLMLAVFNLLPGFPMDGGRLFRALLWWRSGDLMQATQMAARVGGGFGWIFIGIGIIQLYSGHLINGLWMILIGWFVRRLALSSVTGLMLDQALRGFDVSALMRTRFDSVPAGTSTQDFIENYLLRSHQQLWPVVGTSGPIGYIISERFQIPLSDTKTSDDIVDAHAQPLDTEHVIAPDVSAKEAFTRLAAHPFPLPVVKNHQIIGIINHCDVLRWFAFHKISP